MSDYIYGSSLRAAKSKANYLFEGDFRRRPNQNLSGASRSLARGELLQQAAEQRQNREDVRKKEQASRKIQSVLRGYRCRKLLGQQMRNRFDSMIQTLTSTSNRTKINSADFDQLTREFIIYYHSKTDETRFQALIEFMINHQNSVMESKRKDPKAWLHKIVKLLKMNLNLLQKTCLSADSKCLLFLEIFTRLHETLDENQAKCIWHKLIENEIYSILRQLVKGDFHGSVERRGGTDNDLNRSVIELIRRSLEVDFQLTVTTTTIFMFFNEFLLGPPDTTLDTLILPELLRSRPKGLQAKAILKAFGDQMSIGQCNFRIAASFNQIQQSTDSIWLCYHFVQTIYPQLSQIEDSQKVDYINILSNLISPAEYITSISLMQAANDEDADVVDEDKSAELSYVSKNHQIYQHHTEINSVITRLVDIINDLPHYTYGLKPVIFNVELQPKVQTAIVQICNLMLAHEPLAIFNCRLLYTVAFSKEFSRSLWKSITTTTSTTLYGTNTPIYTQLTSGNNISQESWKLILPQLRLFCSLYSYLLPTLDDEEFYTNTDKKEFVFTENETSEKQQQVIKKTNSSSTFFTDRELVSMSAILRDLCVGFIDILYQDNRHTYHHSSAVSTSGFQDERSKLLSFDIKICFKALVRLVCQLHARDSRKQFCPDRHWICPSVVIPANKAVDFQLVASQTGRLLSHMTKDDMGSERTSTNSGEIKTVLILQEIPFVIAFQDRVQILHQLLRKEKQLHQSEGYHFGLPGTAIQVQIRRNYIYEDAFEKLSYENEPNMKLPLKVSLINAVGVDEAGIDGGGLSKEFLGDLLKAGFDPMRGFFKSTNDNHLYPNPSANVIFSTLPEGYETHYEFLGRILGKAIFEKIMVELPMAGFFLAKLLAREHSSDIDLHNLASLDPVLYKNLVYLKNYKGDVADLNLDFTISNNELGEHEVVELKPAGTKIPVTRENKIEYVHLVADYRLNKQIRAQCAAFKRGLAQLIDLDWLRMFDSRELQILISGAPTLIDIGDWRRHTLYANGYEDESEAINTFWRVTSQFNENQKRKLLKFATSCSLPPLLGFKDLVPQFTIAPTEETRLPTASTCMNLLKLPECEDEATMRSKLLYAIESNSGFELS